MDTEVRISGSFSFSSGVKRERTKSTSPSFWRSSSFPVPRRRRGKFSVLSSEIRDFKPLFPPAEPDSRKRVVPNGRLKSSQITKIFSGGIL